MGKGDIRTKKGKITAGSYGNTRKRKKSKPIVVKKKSTKAKTTVKATTTVKTTTSTAKPTKNSAPKKATTVKKSSTSKTAAKK